jgi:hypothetical protein
VIAGHTGYASPEHDVLRNKHCQHVCPSAASVSAVSVRLFACLFSVCLPVCLVYLSVSLGYGVAFVLCIAEILALDSDLSPMASIADAGGPMKTILACFHFGEQMCKKIMAATTKTITMQQEAM